MNRLFCLAIGSGLTFGCTLLVACSDSATGSPTAASGTSTSSTTSGAGGSTAGVTSTGATTSSTSVTSAGGSAGSSSSTTTTASGGSGGAATGQGGSGGATGSGGSGGSGATDAGSDGKANGGGTPGTDAAVGDSGYAPITECSKPSVDRLEQWMTSAPSEGTTIPPSGDLLVMEGDHYVAKVQFIINNGAYCVCPVYLNNAFSSNADLSTSSGFTLTYSSTADMYVQARPTSHWSGGTQWATLIPSTNGVKQSVFFSFDPAKWKSIFDPQPTWTFASTLKEVLGFVFVGNKPNVITFYGMRFDGFTPTCR